MSQKARRDSTSAGTPLRDSVEYDVQSVLENFWPSQLDKIEHLPSSAFREQHNTQELPLARIKKIMKLDDEVKNQMISAEAPVLFAKAAEMFIEELTLRAWVHTEENKRKTLQKNDIAMAISKFDQFDFLIDIVPREEIRSPPKKPQNDAVQFVHVPASSISNTTASAPTAATSAATLNDRHFFVQLANPTPQLGAPQTVQLQNGQILQATPIGQPVQLVTGPNGELQLVQPTHQTQGQHQTSQNQQQQPQEQFPQVFQQIIAADGTIQHVPLQLSPAQLQYLKAQFGGGGGGNAGTGQQQSQRANGE